MKLRGQKIVNKMPSAKAKSMLKQRRQSLRLKLKKLLLKHRFRKRMPRTKFTYKVYVYKYGNRRLASSRRKSLLLRARAAGKVQDIRKRKQNAGPSIFSALNSQFGRSKTRTGSDHTKHYGNQTHPHVVSSKNTSESPVQSQISDPLMSRLRLRTPLKSFKSSVSKCSAQITGEKGMKRDHEKISENMDPRLKAQSPVRKGRGRPRNTPGHTGQRDHQVHPIVDSPKERILSVSVQSPKLLRSSLRRRQPQMFFKSSVSKGSTLGTEEKRIKRGDEKLNQNMELLTPTLSNVQSPVRKGTWRPNTSGHAEQSGNQVHPIIASPKNSIHSVSFQLPKSTPLSRSGCRLRTPLTSFKSSVSIDSALGTGEKRMKRDDEKLYQNMDPLTKTLRNVQLQTPLGKGRGRPRSTAGSAGNQVQPIIASPKNSIHSISVQSPKSSPLPRTNFRLRIPQTSDKVLFSTPPPVRKGRGRPRKTSSHSEQRDNQVHPIIATSKDSVDSVQSPKSNPSLRSSLRRRQVQTRLTDKQNKCLVSKGIALLAMEKGGEQVVEKRNENTDPLIKSASALPIAQSLATRLSQRKTSGQKGQISNQIHSSGDSPQSAIKPLQSQKWPRPTRESIRAKLNSLSKSRLPIRKPQTPLADKKGSSLSKQGISSISNKAGNNEGGENIFENANPLLPETVEKTETPIGRRRNSKSAGRPTGQSDSRVHPIIGTVKNSIHSESAPSPKPIPLLRSSLRRRQPQTRHTEKQSKSSVSKSILVLTTEKGEQVTERSNRNRDPLKISALPISQTSVRRLSQRKTSGQKGQIKSQEGPRPTRESIRAKLNSLPKSRLPIKKPQTPLADKKGNSLPKRRASSMRNKVGNAVDSEIMENSSPLIPSTVEKMETSVGRRRKSKTTDRTGQCGSHIYSFIVPPKNTINSVQSQSPYSHLSPIIYMTRLDEDTTRANSSVVKLAHPSTPSSSVASNDNAISSVSWNAQDLTALTKEITETVIENFTPIDEIGHCRPATKRFSHSRKLKPSSLSRLLQHIQKATSPPKEPEFSAPTSRIRHRKRSSFGYPSPAEIYGRFIEADIQSQAKRLSQSQVRGTNGDVSVSSQRTNTDVPGNSEGQIDPNTNTNSGTQQIASAGPTIRQIDPNASTDVSEADNNAGVDVIGEEHSTNMDALRTGQNMNMDNSEAEQIPSSDVFEAEQNTNVDVFEEPNISMDINIFEDSNASMDIFEELTTSMDIVQEPNTSIDVFEEPNASIDAFEEQNMSGDLFGSEQNSANMDGIAAEQKPSMDTFGAEQKPSMDILGAEQNRCANDPIDSSTRTVVSSIGQTTNKTASRTNNNVNIHTDTVAVSPPMVNGESSDHGQVPWVHVKWEVD